MNHFTKRFAVSLAAFFCALSFSMALEEEEIVFNYPTGEESSSPIMVRVVAPKVPRFNQETTMRLDVFNRSELELKDIEIDYTLPEGFVVTEVQPKVEIKSGLWSQKLDSLPASTVLRYSLKGYFTKGGTVNSGLRVFCSQLIRPQSEWKHFVKDDALLELNIVGPIKAPVGQVVPLRVRIKNVAVEDVSDLKLDVQVEGSGVLTNPSQEIGDLAAGEEKVIGLEFHPKATGNDKLFITVANDADVRSATTYDIRVIPGQMLTSDMMTLKAVKGSRFAYGFTCTNSNDQFANNTVVQMKIPEGVTIDRTKPTAEKTENYLIWKLGNLSPQEVADITFWGVVNTDGAKALDITAIADDFSSSAMNVGVETKEFGNLVIELVDSADPVNLGDPLTLNVQIENTGTAEAELGTIKLRFTPTAFKVLQPADQSENALNGFIQWPAGTKVPPGETTTFSVDFEANQVGNHEFGLVYITPELVNVNYKETVRVLFKPSESSEPAVAE